ncbi:MAG: ComEC/Rec2 family competence protein [Candidatus Paceibacterota bacterium]
MHKSDIFLNICLFFLGGIFFASFFIDSYFLYWAVFSIIVGISLIGVFWKKGTALFGVGLIIFSLGIFCFSAGERKVEAFPINSFDQQEVILQGVVLQSLDGFEKKKIIVDVFSVDGNEKRWGKILVYSDKYLDAEYGSKVEIKGIIKRPTNFSEFDYKGYLSRDGISCISTYPSVKVLNGGSGNIIFSYTEDLKKKISSSIDTDFPPVLSSIVQAMVLGQSEKMSEELKSNLSKSGISHAIAISGSHFVLIASFLFNFLLFLGLWKKKSLTLTMVLIFCYIILISFPASSVRAGIMIGCIYLAKILDRNTQQWRILIFAAFAMCLQNPLIMKYDLGFQLSFLAVAGLIFLAPIVDLFLKKIKFLKNDYLRNLLSTTFAAQIAVLPLIFHISQTFSAFSFVANILIIPLMPICLALGFFYCLLFFIPFLPELIAFLLFPLISFLRFIAEVFAMAPSINYDFSFGMVILSYLFLIVFAWTQRKKTSFDFLSF